MLTKFIPDDQKGLVDRRVLHFDHNEFFYQRLRGTLNRFGVVSYLVSNLVELRRTTQTFRPRLLILDYESLGSRAMDFLERMGGRWGRPLSRFVVLTSEGNPLTIKKCMDLGATTVFTKPVDVDDLGERIWGILRGAEVAGESMEPGIFGGLEESKGSTGRIRRALEQFLGELEAPLHRLNDQLEQERLLEFTSPLTGRLRIEAQALARQLENLDRLREEAGRIHDGARDHREPERLTVADAPPPGEPL